MVLRRIARPLLSTIYIWSGAQALRHTNEHVQNAEPVIGKIAGVLPPQVPHDPTTLVRIDGAVKVGAGVMLALGKLPRLSAFTLAASTVPTTLAGHRFWEEKDDGQRAAQKVHFMKNMGLLGGMLMAASDRGGKPSLSWRASHASHRASERAHEVADTLRESLPGGE